MAGDPGVALPELAGQRVSIRARHRWRAIRRSSVATSAAVKWFQSAPAIDGGRSRRADVQALAAGGVSIRARHRWRAILHTSRHTSRRAVVSIRARHRWRAIRHIHPQGINDGQSFNPRPPSMAGDPGGPSASEIHVGVSIRARHRWRAIPAGRPQGHARTKVSIRARHRWRAIRAWCAMGINSGWFQSAPAIDGGRSSGQGQRLPVIAQVSIRARHRWRAIPGYTRPFALTYPFQSAPAIDGGRS